MNEADTDSLSELANIAADCNGHGFIAGRALLVLTSDAGVTWLHGKVSDVMPGRDAKLYSDGNALSQQRVSADTGRTWRKFTIPDSIEMNGNTEWAWGTAMAVAHCGTLIENTAGTALTIRPGRCTSVQIFPRVLI